MTKPSRKRSEPRRVRPEMVRVMVTMDEKEMLLEAAALNGTPVSVWLRSLGLAAARRLGRQPG